MGIVKELEEIWPNEVCDTYIAIYYESPKEKIASHAFKHLIYNLKAYNGVEI